MDEKKSIESGPRFVCPTEAFAESLSENGNRVYRFLYSHRSSQGT